MIRPMATAKGIRANSAKPKHSRSTVLHSRPPLERMMEIHESVKRGNYPNASTLAQKMEVSPKTIHRDIQFMRDRWNLPIEYDPSCNGFKYTRTVDSLPDTVSIHLNEWDEALSFRHTGNSELEVELFDRICKATAKRKQLKIRYKKPNREPEERTIDPYQIANINNEWYLYAFDHKRCDIRCFLPTRIEWAETTGKIFERPNSFSLDNYLSSSFGVFKGDESYNIRIKFSKTVAPFIKEKNWHPTQKIRPLKNGEVELQMRLSHLMDIKRWILGWGSQAEVLSPDELAETIQAEAKAIIEN